VSAPAKSIATTLATAVSVALMWWAWSLTADPLVRKSMVELRAEAKEIHELLAQENENDRLTTQLEITKIRIERFVEISKVRPLTEAEQIELRAIERERDVILQRLAAKG